MHNYCCIMSFWCNAGLYHVVAALVIYFSRFINVYSTNLIDIALFNTISIFF